MLALSLSWLLFWWKFFAVRNAREKPCVLTPRMLGDTYIVVLSNRNHQWRGLSAHGKSDFEIQSGVSFIFPLSLWHFLPKDTEFYPSLFLESVLQCPTAGSAVTFSAKSHDASRGGTCMGRDGLDSLLLSQATAVGKMQTHSSGNGMRVPKTLSTLLLCAPNVGPVHLALD